MWSVNALLTSSIGVTLKSGFEVIQGHWKWRLSIDHVRLYIGLPLKVLLSL